MTCTQQNSKSCTAKLETGDQSYAVPPYPVTEEDILVYKDFINRYSNEGENE